MKRLLLAAFLLLGNRLAAHPLAVYGEKDTSVADPDDNNPGPKQADHASFFMNLRADLARNTPYEKTADLVNPPSWGKTISAATHGTLKYRASFLHGFMCHVSLENMAPDHEYILTLNGNPERAGNKLLPTPVAANSKENYYDFLIVKTDSKGRYNETLAIFLKPGDYDVRWYVKDTSGFKIVLYRDFFTFEVE